MGESDASGASNRSDNERGLAGAVVWIVGDDATLTRQAVETVALLGGAATVVSDPDEIDHEEALVFVALAEAPQRRNLVDALQQRHRLVTLIHPSATVSPSASIAHNVLIGAQAVVAMDAVVAPACVINAHCTVEHDNVLGAGAFLGTGVTFCGRVTIGAEVFVGGGAVVKPGTTIDDGATIGTGAVVIRDVDAGTVVVGNPARPLGQN